MSLDEPTPEASAVETTAEPDEQAAFEALRARFEKKFPDGIEDVPRWAWLRIAGEKWRWDAEAYLAFYRSYPYSPHRWEVADWFLQREPNFCVGFTPEFEERPVPANYILDLPAKAEWEKAAVELRAAMETATDLPVRLQEERARRKVMRDLDAAKAAAQKGLPVDLGRFRSIAAGHLAAFPGEDGAFVVGVQYLSLVRIVDRTRYEAEWDTFLRCPNHRLRAEAEGRIRFSRLRQNPIDLRFTAVDGREVDLRKMRGKVVLLDFWATRWAPSVEEELNILPVYRKYHERGFEVIGICIDTEAGRHWLGEFVEKHDMPWPQYFDGKQWDGELVKTFSIFGLPETLLLDQRGMIAATNPFGAELEPAVRRLLRL